MKPMRRALVLTLLIVAVRGDPASGQPLTLQQAVDRALAANPGVRAAEAAADESAARVLQARAGYLPRLDLVESWQRGNQPVYVFGSLLSQRRFTEAGFAIDALNHPDPVTSHRTGLTVQQTVFDGLRTRSLVRAAEIGRTMALTGVERTRNELAVSVTETYGRILLAAAGRRAAEAAVSTAEEDLRLAERRRDVGMGTEADVLSLQVHLAQMRERQIRMANDEGIARAALNRLMGDPLDEIHTLAEFSPESPDLSASLDALEQEALRDRPEARQAALAVDLASATRRASSTSRTTTRRSPRIAATCGSGSSTCSCPGAASGSRTGSRPSRAG